MLVRPWRTGRSGSAHTDLPQPCKYHYLAIKNSITDWDLNLMRPQFLLTKSMGDLLGIFSNYFYLPPLEGSDCVGPRHPSLPSFAGQTVLFIIIILVVITPPSDSHVFVSGRPDNIITADRLK